MTRVLVSMFAAAGVSGLAAAPAADATVVANPTSVSIPVGAYDHSMSGDEGAKERDRRGN